MNIEDVTKFKDLISGSKKVLIVQAENPDADSLGSAIALEQLLSELKIETHLYCAVNMPSYLKYVSGWDRVSSDFITDFDLTIFVDVSTTTLLKKVSDLGFMSKIKQKKSIVIDHHTIVNNNIDFSDLSIVPGEKSSTGQIIYELAKENDWQSNELFLESVLISILGDTQGLSNQLTTPEVYRIVADIIETGVDRFAVEQRRKEFGSLPAVIFKYKAELINRTLLINNDTIGLLILNQDDINNYSQLYNQAPLMHSEILQITNMRVGIIIKSYSDGHLTGSIRTNNNAPIAALLASNYDGGGHKNASGFNIVPANFDDFITDLVLKTTELLDNINNEVI